MNFNWQKSVTAWVGWTESWILLLGSETVAYLDWRENKTEVTFYSSNVLQLPDLFCILNVAYPSSAEAMADVYKIAQEFLDG
jgi:hypothetical protein